MWRRPLRFSLQRHQLDGSVVQLSTVVCTLAAIAERKAPKSKWQLLPSVGTWLATNLDAEAGWTCPVASEDSITPTREADESKHKEASDMSSCLKGW